MNLHTMRTSNMLVTRLRVVKSKYECKQEVEPAKISLEHFVSDSWPYVNEYTIEPTAGATMNDPQVLPIISIPQMDAMMVG